MIEGFKKRLAQACDMNDLPVHGRQSYIANNLGVKPQAVSQWFQGNFPSTEHQVQVSDLLDVHPGWLIYGTGAPR